MDIGERRLLLVGDYSREEDFHNGISSKLRSLDALAGSMYSSVEVLTTRSWKNFLKVLLRLPCMMKGADDVFCCLSLNGTRLLLPLILALARLFRKRVFYFQPGIGTLLLEAPSRDPEQVVGFLKDPRSWKPGKKRLARLYRRLDGYLVETKALKEAVSAIYGVDKVAVFPNFRDWEPSLPRERGDGPIRLVYFARVTPLKGLGALLEAMEEVNVDHPGAFSLDVWGAISDREWFSSLKWPSNCHYLGASGEGDKLSLLAKYDWLVLPTHCWEGVPGTIVEARFAGLPVLSSSFPSAEELIADDVDGFLYEFRSQAALSRGLERVLLAKDRLHDFHMASLSRSEEFGLQKAKDILLSIVSH